MFAVIMYKTFINISIFREYSFLKWVVIIVIDFLIVSVEIWMNYFKTLRFKYIISIWRCPQFDADFSNGSYLWENRLCSNWMG